MMKKMIVNTFVIGNISNSLLVICSEYGNIQRKIPNLPMENEYFLTFEK